MCRVLSGVRETWLPWYARVVTPNGARTQPIFFCEIVRPADSEATASQIPLPRDYAKRASLHIHAIGQKSC